MDKEGRAYLVPVHAAELVQVERFDGRIGLECGVRGLRSATQQRPPARVCKYPMG